MPSPPDGAIRYDVVGRTATITLNRPERLNAFTADMTASYAEALATAELDHGVRVIVLTGAGSAFSAGADFAVLADIIKAGGFTVANGGQTAPHGPWSSRPGGTIAYTMAAALAKPVIAAINGPAAGVGFVIALSADLRFAAPGAKLVTSYARLGLPAEYGVAWLLPHLVGHGRAVDLLLSARAVPADEALAMGLVNRLVPHDQLVDEVAAYAGQLAELSPRSLAAMKAQLTAAPEQGFAATLAESVDRMEQMTRQPDFAEGVAAALEKRPPAFPD